MEFQRARTILNNLYGLLMEMNLYQDDEDVFSTTNVDDPFIQKHLGNVRLLTSKYAASYSKSNYRNLMNEFLKLKEKGLDELKSFLQPSEVVKFEPMFRKFEELTSEDEQEIIQDQEFLQLIEHLKKRLDEE